MIKRKVAKEFLHKQLIIQLLLFAVVFIVVAGIVGYDVIAGNINFLLALVGVLIGLAIGFFFANRMFKVHWNNELKKIMVGRDRASVLFILIYIVLRFVSNDISSAVIPAAVVTYFTLSTVGGIMLGRLLGLMRTIERIVAEQKLA